MTFQLSCWFLLLCLRQLMCSKWSFQVLRRPKKNAVQLFKVAITITGKRNLVNGGWGSEAQFCAQEGFAIDLVSERKWIYCSLGSCQSSSKCVSYCSTPFSLQLIISFSPRLRQWLFGVFLFCFFFKLFQQVEAMRNFRAPNTPPSFHLERIFDTHKTSVCVMAMYSLSSAPWSKDTPRPLAQYSVQGKSKPQMRTDTQVIWMSSLPAAEELKAAREFLPSTVQRVSPLQE